MCVQLLDRELAVGAHVEHPTLGSGAVSEVRDLVYSTSADAIGRSNLLPLNPDYLCPGR